MQHLEPAPLAQARRPVAKHASATAEAAPTEARAAVRLLHVDHLRNIVILGLILFHTARLFDSDPWHVKDAGRYLAADLLIAAFNIVQMPLLFFLAGIAAFHSLRSRSAGRFLKERMLKIGLPLLAGILLVVPPQVYVERLSTGMSGRMSPIDFSGSYGAFYGRFFSCCYPAANFSWHHLWFLIYLLAYSLILLPLLLVLCRPTVHASIVSLGDWLARGPRLMLLALPILASELALRRSFPSTHALIDDFANHAHYLVLILTGWLVAASPALASAAARAWTWLLGAAALAIGLWLLLRATGTGLPHAERQALRALAEWTAIAGLFGWASCHLARPLPFLTAFSAIGFGFYILHQTLIVLLGFWLAEWSDAPFAKFAVVAAASFAASLLMARLSLSSRLTRTLLGLRG